MSDYFDKVELELRAAALRRVPAEPAGRGHPSALRGLGAAVTVLAAGAASVIAVFAIIALGRGHRPATSTSATAHSDPGPYYRECFPIHHRVGCLTADYGVLRRPSAGPRPIGLPRVVPRMWFAGIAALQTHVTLLPQLNRSIQSGPTRTILFVARSTLGPPNYYMGYYVSVSGSKPRFVRLYWPFMPSPLEPGRTATKWLLEASPSVWVRGYEVTVVPDLIARVRWVFPAHGATAARSVSASVRDNVAVAPAPDPSSKPVMTEYGANGRVLAIQGQLPLGMHATKPRMHATKPKVVIRKRLHKPLIVQRLRAVTPHHPVGQRHR